MKDANKLLKKLVKIRSFSGKEIQIYNYIFTLLEKKVLMLKRFPLI